MSQSSGGSPAFLSWLPRTMVSSISARAWRHSAKRCRVLAVRPAALCRKSPRKTTCRAPVLSSARPRRSIFSFVVPEGSGMPARRKLAALPRWKSAMKSVFPAGQYAAFSARSTSRSPLTRHPTKEGSLLFVVGGRGPVVCELHARHAIGELLVGELLAEAAHHDRKGEGRRLVRLPQQHLRLRHPPQSLGEAREFELPLQDLALCLSQQRVLRIPAREDLVDEPARRLHLAIGLGLPGIALEHEARHARDLSGQKLEAVIGEGKRERAGARLRQAMGQQRRKPQVHLAPFERIEKDVVAFARLGLLDQ